ncbi:protein of unknown function [uncultured Sphingopyxis sp.]|uniref:NACHT domain-containing protein n=1 Tax=uncultured Sphingopyxis sp. TaxID=310581 RepID=A0A1Y5PXB3_9SPHN|nr:restriction endonuclease [uncultured Sphingopyxis sp.]SBV31864.1 protein of unknown function [uncultured Sphingopyxis sp.]
MNLGPNIDETDASPPRLHIVAQSPTFPLLELGDYQFERLVRDLLAAEAAHRQDYDAATLMPQGADRGRDILLYRQGRLAGIVQCKRLKHRMRLSDIKYELIKYCLFAVRDPSIAPRGSKPGYRFWTAGELTEEAKQFFDDAAVQAKTLLALSPGDVENVRASLKSLSANREGQDEDALRRETLDAIDLARRLTLSHTGPSDIYALLRKHEGTRRAYFRSPDDGPPRASVLEVATLLDARRRQELAQFADAGAAGNNPFVPRAAIDEPFADFMASGSRLFVLVGGSGQGKTSWAAHLAESPPGNWSAHIVRAEDIAEADHNIVDTLKRDLQARPTGGTTMHDLAQSIWDWVDSGNHILVVDGLDRTRSAARDALPGWLRQSAQLTREHAVRLVLTSRRESWAAISADLPWQPPHLHAPGDARMSAELGALTHGEAERVYDAYGVATGRHGGRLLDSPSLIRRFAQLKDSDADKVVTRYDVLSADFEAMLVELGKRQGVTKVAATLVMGTFGDLLPDYPDGWVPLAALAAAGQQGPAVLDALVAGDRATIRGDDIRLESDDMIELVIGRRLSPDTAADLFYQRREEPLLVGGIAMMIARTEAQSVDAARDLLDTLLAVTPTGMSGALDAIARSLLEVRNPASFIEHAAAAVGRWRDTNLALGLSQLGEMIASIALPAADRLRLMWPLVANEDADDWRSKYWFAPGQAGRIVTAFASAAERAARESGPDVLDFLIERAGDADKASQAVARYLLHSAAEAAPDMALAKCWEAPRDGFDTAFAIAASSVPGAAARFLGSEQAASAPIEELVSRLHELAGREPIGRIRPPSAEDVMFAVERLLPRAGEPQQEALLLIAALRYEANDGRRSRLVALWDHVETSDYWDALSVLGDGEQERLVAALITGADSSHDRTYLLGASGAHRLGGAVYSTFMAHLETLYRQEPELAHPIALAVEGMLYEVPPAEDAGGRIFRLAQDIASGKNDKARLALLYYAGSPQGRDQDGSDLARREALLARLVEAETGANLGVLLWKIAESANERANAPVHAMRLIDRLGAEPVLKVARAMGSLDYMRDVLEEIERRRAARGEAGFDVAG